MEWSQLKLKSQNRLLPIITELILFIFVPPAGVHELLGENMKDLYKMRINEIKAAKAELEQVVKTISANLPSAEIDENGNIFHPEADMRRSLWEAKALLIVLEELGAY